jgi:DNA-damage-inducible protein J
MRLTCVANATHSWGMKTAAIHSRIDPETKARAEMILHRLGMSPTEAIRMFYTQITLRNGLPFTVEIPNEETEKALDDSRSCHNLERFESVDALIESWK